jgi:outer membrane protein
MMHRLTLVKPYRQKNVLRWVAAAVVMGSQLLAANTAWALASDVKNTVTRLLLQKQPDRALAVLEPLEDSHTEDFDFALLMGTSSVDAGQADRGIIYLLRAQAMRPRDAFVRAELARAYLAAGEYASAQAALEGVSTSDAPPSAQTNLSLLRLRVQSALQASSLLGRNEAEAVRQALEQRLADAKPWSAQLSASLGYDNNINLAPRAREITIPVNVPFIGGLTAQSARLKHSAFSDVSAYGLYRAVFSDSFAWQTSGQLSHRSYPSEHKFDSSLVALRSGPLMALARQVAVQAELDAQHQWQDGSPTQGTLGLAMSLRWQGGQGSALQGGSLYFTPSRVDDERTDGLRDSRRKTYGASLFGRGLLGAPSANWDANAYGLRERLKEPGLEDLSYNGWGLRLGLRQPVSETVALGVAVSAEKRGYKGQDAFFLSKRRDLQKDLSLFAEIGLKKDQLALVPSVQINRNQSNLPTYDTKRVQAHMALRALY